MCADRSAEISNPRVIIVGGGFGGLTAAKKLSRSGMRVTLIDKRNYHLFQPLLYQVATAALSPADIAVPIRSILTAGNTGGVEILLDEVTGVEKDTKQILTRSGRSLPYDYLILATGSRYDYFGHDEWMQFAPSLKSLEDATDIRRRVLLAFERAETSSDENLRQRLLTFLIVGGGPTGVETAGAIAELVNSALGRDFTHIKPQDARVVLLEAGDSILTAFAPGQQRYTIRTLEKLGVEVWLNSPVEAITDQGATVKGELIHSANTLWCAGVRATPVANWLGAESVRNGAVKVNQDMSVPDHPEVFVVGDAAFLPGPNGKPYPAIAPVAKQQGAHAAKTIIQAVRGGPNPGPFRYFNYGNLATIGRSAAVGQFAWLNIQGFFAWLFWGMVHIMYLIGFRNRLIVAINWFWAWVTYAKGARLITGSTELDDATHAPPKLPAQRVQSPQSALDPLVGSTGDLHPAPK